MLDVFLIFYWTVIVKSAITRHIYCGKDKRNVTDGWRVVGMKIKNVLNFTFIRIVNISFTSQYST